MVDLHMHTNMSDGSDSPLELLEKVEAAGLEFFSVTDHDDLRANAIIKAAKAGKNYKVTFNPSCDIFSITAHDDSRANEITKAEKDEKRYKAIFIPGCEISSVFEGRNLHLLCYDFDIESESMKTLIAEGAALRRQRITAMIDHLRNKHNIIIPDEDKADILSRAIPGKVHITDAAMKLGIKMSRQQFFDTCLDDMESREFKVSAERVINLVHESRGVVSFAHPIEVQREYKIADDEIEVMAKKLKDEGLTAIEVFHSLHGREQVAHYKCIASKVGLYISGGSDYHGKNKNVKIGQLNNYGYTPPDDTLDLLELFKIRRYTINQLFE